MQTHTEKHNGFSFRKSLILKIFIAVPIILVLGATSGIVTSGNMETWYETLNEPSIKPPNYLFGIVWSILYVMIGTSFALIWHKFINADNAIVKKKAQTAIIIFSIHFVLNLMWTIIFFGMHEMLFALIEIITLLLFIVWTMKSFYGLNKLASLLLLPYLLWVSFATILNLEFYLLN